MPDRQKYEFGGPMVVAESFMEPRNSVATNSIGHSSQWLLRKSLSTLATIVADLGDNLSPKTATVISATVAVFGDSRRFR